MDDKLFLDSVASMEVSLFTKNQDDILVSVPANFSSILQSFSVHSSITLSHTRTRLSPIVSVVGSEMLMFSISENSGGDGGK
ncbi:hypothetical protein J6T66_00905 [bacterium]|nr:hypothetical protein [bacterium]